MDLSDEDTHCRRAHDNLKNSDVTLASFSEKLDERHSGKTIDAEWLRWVTQLLAKLKHLRWQYTDGDGRRGRSSMGIINSTGCTSVWASDLPVQPLPVPLDQPPLPGLALHGNGYLRRPHGPHGGRLPRRPHGRTRIETAATTSRKTRRASSPTSTGSSSPTRNSISARRWSRSAVTARCTISASRTSPA